MTSETIIFTMKTCPNCELLKQLFKTENIPFEVVDMQTPVGASELFSSNVFVMQAPILKYKNKFHTDLTTVGKLDVQKVKRIIAG